MLSQEHIIAEKKQTKLLKYVFWKGPDVYKSRGALFAHAGEVMEPATTKKKRKKNLHKGSEDKERLALWHFIWSAMIPLQNRPRELINDSNS